MAGDSEDNSFSEIDEARSLIDSVMSNGQADFTVIHEIFLGFLEGGFTERQALWLVAAGVFGNTSMEGGTPE